MMKIVAQGGKEDRHDARPGVPITDQLGLLELDAALVIHGMVKHGTVLK
jgi:hypothetical protein